MKTLENGFDNRKPIPWIGIGVTMSGLFFGLAPMNGMVLSCTLILMCCFYHRDFSTTLWIGIVFLLATLFQGFRIFYFYSIVFCIYALMITFTRLLKGNLYAHFPYIVSILGFLSHLVASQQWIEAFEILGLSWILCQECLSLNHFSSSDHSINSLIQGILCFSVFEWTQFLPSWFQIGFEGFLLIFFARRFELNEFFLLALSSLFFFSISFMDQGLLLPLLVLSLIKKENLFVQCIMFALFLALVRADYREILIAVLFLMIASFGMKTEKNKLGIEETLQRDLRIQKHLLQHQLREFAQIFECIARYFNKNHETEALFLRGMATSMEDLSLQLNESSLSVEEESTRIVRLLQGYHYPVIKVKVNEEAKGQKWITLTLEESSKKEEEEIILPLLQMVIDKNLKIISRQKNWMNNSIQIEFAGLKPLPISGKVIQRKKNDEASGDTCSIFRVNHKTVCTLSDGMGAGRKAERASEFVTELTQRLLSSGIPIEMAIQSMNSLLKLSFDESFATLDILIFDENSRQVYCSKSGACATFLLRDHQILKIQSESLPLGIIHKITSDCFLMDVHEKDVFVLFSDGIEESELERWCAVERNQLSEEIKSKMERIIMKDDATVLLVSVG